MINEQQKGWLLSRVGPDRGTSWPDLTSVTDAPNYDL
jgi:hypothetical protein